MALATRCGVLSSPSRSGSSPSRWSCCRTNVAYSPCSTDRPSSFAMRDPTSSGSARPRRRVIVKSDIGSPSAARWSCEHMLLAALDRRFRLQAGEVPPDGHYRERPALRHEAGRAVAACEVAREDDVVPLLGVPDVTERHVVVVAPEERHGVEAPPSAEDVPRGGLSLPFGDDPVLDADALGRVRVGPARDVAG